ncbi:hypothetical protein BGX30_003421 [Mortierella sp. GBA39]|nr:hypothetical protein BGX30_003421 [Mortierella sp. GBA39]
MEFTSIIAFLTLSAAALVALPVVANTPVQIYRRAACNSHEKGVLDELMRTLNALSQLEDQYYRVTRNPLLGLTFNRAKENLNIIIVETKDEQLRTGLESNCMTYPGPGSRRSWGGLTISHNVNTDINELIRYWKKAGGK